MFGKQNKSNKGALLALVLPLMFSLFLIGIFIMDIGQGFYLKERVQIHADQTLWGSLALWSEGLEGLARNWNESGLYRRDIVSNKVNISKADQLVVTPTIKKLSRRHSGYKGRLTAIRRVISEANGAIKENLNFDSFDLKGLGLVSQDLMTIDDQGKPSLIKNGWYKQDRPLSNPLTLSATIKYQPIGSSHPWVITAHSSGNLIWDIDENRNDILLAGNGGYPKHWSAALYNNQLDPHRYPIYRPRLYE